MKKIAVLILVFCSLIIATAFSQQEVNPPDSAKRAYIYFVKIETLNGEKTESALSRFSDDSVFLIPVEKKFVLFVGPCKIIRNEEENGIAAVNISKIHILKDHNIIYADSLKKRKGEAFVDNLVLSVFSFAGDAFISAIPVSGFESLSAINTAGYVIVGAAVVGGTLAVTTRGKKFILDGDKEKYKQMLLDLMKVKKRKSINNYPQTNG